MTVEYVLQYIDPKRMDVSNLGVNTLNHKGYGCIFPNGLIIIDGSVSEEEQILSVLHEIWHMHPRFIAYTGGKWQGTMGTLEDVESEIEAAAQETYNMRPDVVERVKSALSEAKVISQDLEDKTSMLMRRLNRSFELRSGSSSS